jgi:hypothetical protein
MKRSILFLCLLVRADTLSLRNGTSVSGNWVSIDNREISFTVNGEVRSYPRADVWRVTFGEGRVKLGQTLDEVKTALGPPKNVIDNGVKTIYVYADMKLTFIDGKVSAIE